MLRCLSLVLFLAFPMMVSGQDVDEDVEVEEAVTPHPQRPVKQAVNYEMREVCGLVVDAATHQPIDGARVQAYGYALYSAMTDEDGTYWLKVPVFVKSLYVSVPGYNDVQVAFGKDQRVPNVEMYSSKFNAVYQPETRITAGSKAEMDVVSSTTIDSEIEGKLSGDIRTINRTGVQGQGAAMFIRGLNSLNLNARRFMTVYSIISSQGWTLRTLKVLKC